MSSAETPPLCQGPPTQLYHFRDYNPIPKVSYITTLDQATAVFGGLLPSGPLGFDLEWRPTYTKGAPENPVALIQLADQHSIMLFQVSRMRGRHYTSYPSANQNHSCFSLQNSLQSSSGYWKAHRLLKQALEFRVWSCLIPSPTHPQRSFTITGDASKLFKDCNVSMCNCVDLSLLARTVDNPRWAGRYNSPIGLARLIECYESKLLLKGRVSRSDWTAALSSKQQECETSNHLLSTHTDFTFFISNQTLAMTPMLGIPCTKS